jgi:hypothetical protein
MDMKIGTVYDTLEGTIVGVSEPKTVPTKYGKNIKVATAKFKSVATGEIDLTLWAENATAYRPGDKVKITNVEVKEYRDMKSLSIAPPSKGGSIVRV